MRALAIVLLVGCEAPATSSRDFAPADFAVGAARDFSTVTLDLSVAGSADLSMAATTARVIFQCRGLAGGLCVMNADGSGKSELRVDGRVPDQNAAGEILFHSNNYVLQKRAANGSVTPLGDGAFGKWRKDGSILFQCSGLGGGVCTMNPDGSGRDPLRATGRSPDENPAGVILFHDDNYGIQKRATDGSLTPLGDGAFPRWQADGTILFQCVGLGTGGVCRMNADGQNRSQLRAAGRAPDGNAAGEVLFHDDNYVLQKRTAAGNVTPLGEGAFPRWL